MSLQHKCQNTEHVSQEIYLQRLLKKPKYEQVNYSGKYSNEPIGDMEKLYSTKMSNRGKTFKEIIVHPFNEL